MKAALDDDDFGEHILVLFVGDITSVAYLEPSIEVVCCMLLFFIVLDDDDDAIQKVEDESARVDFLRG